MGFNYVVLLCGRKIIWIYFVKILSNTSWLGKNFEWNYIFFFILYNLKYEAWDNLVFSYENEFYQDKLPFENWSEQNKFLWRKVYEIFTFVAFKKFLLVSFITFVLIYFLSILRNSSWWNGKVYTKIHKLFIFFNIKRKVGEVFAFVPLIQKYINYLFSYYLHSQFKHNIFSSFHAYIKSLIYWC